MFRQANPSRPPAPGSTAARVLAALEPLFLVEGYRRLAVGELARRLRCSRRTLYELAPTKQGLFALVVDRFLARIRAQGDAEAATADDLATRIERYLAPGIRETKRAAAVFFADVAALPEAKRLLDAHQRRRIAGIRDLVTQGIRQRVFRGIDPHLVAEVFSEAYRRVSQPDFLAASTLSMAEAYSELSHLLRHGLLHAENPAVRRSRKRRS
jgi:AcrR family transcriptional regulator